MLTVFVRVNTDSVAMDWFIFLLASVVLAMLFIYAGYIIGREE